MEWNVNLSPNVFLIIFLSAILIAAAVQDLRFQKIPNLFTYPTMAIGLACHGMTNGLDGLLFSAGGLALGIGIFILPYLMGKMGAGDAKLMGAVGAVLGLRGVFIAILFTALVGGVYALIILFISRRKGFFSRLATSLETFVFTGQFIPVPAAEGEKEPRLCYGVAIAFGTLLYIFLDALGYGLII
ncbi:MAG: prepilin peptidase [Deltaproteobacteria bacterium]|nr:prepilin peptidase [Deltaproteobacteria bacterium]